MTENNETIWNIVPLQSVGPLKLGMSRQEVATLEPILGEIYREIEEDIPGVGRILKQARDLGSPVLTFQSDALVEINLDQHSRHPIMFDGVDIYRSPAKSVLAALQKANGGQALTGLGLVLFEKLSINTGGFFIPNKGGDGGRYWDDVGDASQPRTMSVAVKDRFAPFLSHYKPISFD